MSARSLLALSGLFIFVRLFAQTAPQNNTLQGRVLYQSSGNKPAAGVQIRERDSNGDYSKDKGEYRLVFQSKRNGMPLEIEISPDTRDNKKIELVNEKEVRSAKLPASVEDILDIIVCPAGQRDFAAQKYYAILRTTADRELEKKKKEVEILLAQKDRTYEQISKLFKEVDEMKAALDSAGIREQAFGIASINLDRASQMVKDAVQKIETENDVEGALKILNLEVMDTAYRQASAIKKQGELIVLKANAEIRQVVEGLEFKIDLLKQQFKYKEIAECFEKIAEIYKNEQYEELDLAKYLVSAAGYWGNTGDFEKQLRLIKEAYAIQEKLLPADHLDLARTYTIFSSAYHDYGEYSKALEYSFKALAIRQKHFPTDHPDIAKSYDEIGDVYRHLDEHQKRLEYMQKAIDIQEKLLPAGEPQLASYYNNLANTYASLKDCDKELELRLKVLAIRERILAADHPDLAHAYSNLAYTYGHLGKFQKQMEYNLKALTIREKTLSPTSIDLAVSYANLAFNYLDLYDFQKAIDFLLKELAIRENTFPSSHVNQVEIVVAYSNIGGAYRDNGDVETAIAYGEKALSKTRGLNIKASRVRNNLGISYLKIENFARAKELFEESERITTDDEWLYRVWAMYYALQKQKKKAIENLEKAVHYGCKDLKWLREEPFLKNVRKEKGYKKLVEQLKDLQYTGCYQTGG